MNRYILSKTISFLILGLLYGESYVIRSLFHQNIRHSQNRNQMSSQSASIGSETITTSKLNKSPQILSFIDPKTQVPVILIGCMHYNPTSIELAKETIHYLGSKDLLHSVVLETCSSRWHKTIEVPSNISFVKSLMLDNEMETAALTCQQYSRPVVLGDQSINVTSTRVKQLFKNTLRDILSPMDGGWQRIYDDFLTALPKTILVSSSSLSSSSSFSFSLSSSSPSERTRSLNTNAPYINPSVNSSLIFGLEDKYLSISDVLAPKLLMGTPVSLLRYPSAIFLKAPLLGFALLVFFIFSSMSTGSSASDGMSYNIVSLWSFEGVSRLFNSGYDSISPDKLLDAFFEIFETSISVLIELALFSRVFLVGLLSERNLVLADYIQKECDQSLRDSQSSISTSSSSISSMSTSTSVSSWWNQIVQAFHNTKSNSKFSNNNTSTSKIFSSQNQFQSNEIEKNVKPKRAVVAVLGMAHCNGVKKLLMEQKL